MYRLAAADSHHTMPAGERMAASYGSPMTAADVVKYFPSLVSPDVLQSVRFVESYTEYDGAVWYCTLAALAVYESGNDSLQISIPCHTHYLACFLRDTFGREYANWPHI